jgi:hypothetical protein
MKTVVDYSVTTNNSWSGQASTFIKDGKTNLRVSYNLLTMVTQKIIAPNTTHIAKRVVKSDL